MFKKYRRKSRYIKSGLKIALIPTKLKIMSADIVVQSVLTLVSKVVGRNKSLKVLLKWVKRLTKTNV